MRLGISKRVVCVCVCVCVCVLFDLMCVCEAVYSMSTGKRMYIERNSQRAVAIQRYKVPRGGGSVFLYRQSKR